MKKSNLLKIGIITSSLLIALVGCGNKNSNSDTNSRVKTLVAATEGTTRPLEYMDDKGKLTGYEVEVLKAIDSELKDYKIDIQTTEFASIFTGIDSGRYQLGFNNISKTPEREEKYIFPKETHYYEPAGFFVRKGFLKEHPINSVEDLGGLKTVSNSKGDSWQLFVENYNKKYKNNPIKVKYSDQDWGTSYLQVYNGTIDILKGVESRLKMYEDEYNYKFDYVTLPQKDIEELGSPDHWFVFPKTSEGQKTADSFDKVIKKLRDNGTLTKLSIHFLGKDYSSKENYESK
ncbi:transporter substrate-binding domain-containing protein [Rummeliibacillus sp. SL167]|uniref:transporter substrate-binding domain-containing protein n=1 Tax=Rummeliibacillus sp. SL167 TaxID=2579792 RepID=UPI0011B529E0|nr:transporter substrate-binding domain-containing protein [Rummeliibacillus sp. SL167]